MRLHVLCHYINNHNEAAEKIILLLDVGDANVLLLTKDQSGNTPLQLATDNGASDEGKILLNPKPTLIHQRRTLTLRAQR